MSRLKKRTKKSGSGGDAITDMNSTKKWVWEKFSSFFIPHIETVDARNVASFAAAASAAWLHEVVPECEGVIPQDEEGHVLVVIRACSQRVGCRSSRASSSRPLYSSESPNI